MSHHRDTPNPLTIAREVLDDELGWEAKPSDTMHREDVEAVYRLANAAPVLADTVLRVKEMAEDLEVGALWVINHTDLDDDLKAHAHADRGLTAQIRAILNGENRD